MSRSSKNTSTRGVDVAIPEDISVSIAVCKFVEDPVEAVGVYGSCDKVVESSFVNSRTSVDGSLILIGSDVDSIGTSVVECEAATPIVSKFYILEFQ
jgi:hypothetical protein